MDKIFLRSGLIILILGLFVCPAYATWWDESWDYRKEINISNSASEQTNFQALIELNASELYGEGKLNATCNDIRFTNSSSHIIDYWVEDCIVNDNSTLSKIWVKLPYLTNAITKIYMYYGNDGVQDGGNPYNTFIFYDNFTASNTSIWTYYNGAYVSDGSLILTSTSANADTRGKWNYTMGELTIEFAMRKLETSGRDMFLNFYNEDNNDHIRVGDTSYSYWGFYSEGKGEYYNGFKSYGGATNAYREYQVNLTGNSIFGKRESELGSGVNLQSFSETLGSSVDSRIMSPGFGGGGTHYRGGNVDWIRLRKYLSSELTYAIGEEENNLPDMPIINANKREIIFPSRLIIYTKVNQLTA